MRVQWAELQHVARDTLKMSRMTLWGRNVSRASHALVWSIYYEIPTTLSWTTILRDWKLSSALGLLDR